jgi:hypothetical protein
VQVLSDHETGWPGGWSDPAPGNKAENILIDGFDDMLYLSEMDRAFEKILAETARWITLKLTGLMPV